MTTAAKPKGTFIEQGKTFASVAKKFKPRDAHILAIKHVGEPRQYPTEHGAELAHDGDYIVQVGEIEQTEVVPPSIGKDGAKVPGELKKHKVPKLEVMKAEDFEKLYTA
jgi:hypothetical protein